MGNIKTTCHRFGIARSAFYLWGDRYRELGEAGLARRKCDFHNWQAQRTDTSL
ncbi:MAG: helix-turn-helix domain-containing protein [bacterium]|nr:helix-turn-helix domain-containing protein [bacterium]